MKKDESHTDDKPPLLKSWKNMYLLVLLNLAVTVLVFYLIMIYLR